MTFLRLLFRNLLYHWRGNLAVFLGIALGSTVLTGALLVGDSLRGSLKALTLDQLGWVEEVMIPGRFFRAQLASEMAAGRCAPVLLLQGGAARKIPEGEAERVGKVTVFGVNASFWPGEHMPVAAEFWSGSAREVVLNRTLANDLGAKVGDTVRLRLQKADAVPGEILLGKRKAQEVIEPVDVTVRLIIANEGMGRFSLKPTPEPVRNAFVPIGFLQRHKELDLDGWANALLVAEAQPTLQENLHKKLNLDDWGLRFRSPKERAKSFVRLLGGHSETTELRKKRWLGRVPEELSQIAEKNDGILTQDAVVKFYEAKRNYYALESRRMILEPSVVATALALQSSTKGWHLTEMSVYLADGISDGGMVAPYSILVGSNAFANLANDEALLVHWPGSPLRVPSGEQAKNKIKPLAKGPPANRLMVAYYVPDKKNYLQLKQAPLNVKEVVKLEGDFDDPDLTPEYPGITDELDMSSWKNPPFPYDAKRLSDADKEYWKRYRTTPKVYVNLATAKKLWGSRFGEITSILVRKDKESPMSFPEKLLAALKPEQAGFVFQPVREQALAASSGTTPFGVLFLAFSLFLIVSALLLVGLLVRLNIDRRGTEMGLLLAIGWSHAQVRRLLLVEGILLAVSGGLFGLAGAELYADQMLKLLIRNWPDGESLHFLKLYTEPESFVIGYASSLVVTLLTLLWATRALGKLSPRALLFGETSASGPLDTQLGQSRWLIPIGVFVAALLAVIAPFWPSQEAQAGSFFGSGAMLLTAALAAVWNGLKLSNRISSPQPSLTLLGLRNAGRLAVRSVLTVGLLAAASFVVVAVEAFHKGADDTFATRGGGSGGFAFYAEGNVPLFEDLNQPEPRRAYRLDTPEMRRVVLYPCRLQAGDDASCLNLYKPLKPRVMGLSEAFIQRGGFHFADSLAKTPEDKKNPWLLLHKKDIEEPIPAIIDANTAQWILKTSLGATIEVNNDEGKPVKLRIVALLEESIFQSEILISEENFLKLYPRQTGFSFLLVDAQDTNPEHFPAMQKQLSKGLEEIGMDVQTTASRLQGYVAVENTYLTMFQALGGLGLILGAVGLAIVLLRGVWERRAELALLQALGFRSGQLAWLVMVENVFLLLLGLTAGTVSALLAVAPHLIGTGAQVLWMRIVTLLLAVLAVGLLAAGLAVWSTLRTPVLTALRRE